MRMRAMGMAAALGLVCLATPASGDMVAYTGMGTSTSSAPLVAGGVTAAETNGGTLNIDEIQGLGVVGGGSSNAFQNYLIDGNESVLFRFNAGTATAISFRSNAAFVNSASSTENIEGFAAGGRSLGSTTFRVSDTNGSGFNVSALFGNAALSAFRIYGSGTTVGVSVAQITFTPSAVPEPASLALVVTGAAGLLGMARKRRKG